MVKFLIADDHPLMRDALKIGLKPHFEKCVFLESDSLETTIKALRQNRNVSLLILDLSMPGCDNFYGLLRVKSSFPAIPVLVLSASDSLDTVSQVMSFGARGFVSKTSSMEDIKTAITTCLSDKTYLAEEFESCLASIKTEVKDIASRLRELTPKQFQVLRCLKDGMMNKDIAKSLNVTEATVKAHIGVIFKKLNVKTRTQIVLAVEQLQLN